MQTKQSTIKHVVSFQGIGLHSGIEVHVKLLPMPPDTGIQFQRIDLPNQPIIEALVHHVVETERCTILAKHSVKVATVEHLMAALLGMQIDNICIQLDGPEVPDLDGSAQAFVDILLKASLQVQNTVRKFFTIKEKFSYQNPKTGSCFDVYPSRDCSVQCTVVYDKWPLEKQYAILSSLEHFQQEIAPARTFAFLDEIVALHQKGLLKGADGGKAIIFSNQDIDAVSLEQFANCMGKQAIQNVVMPNSIHKTNFHYVNEPARHKLLDLLGDLSLLGRPLYGSIYAYKPGHTANIGFVKALKHHLLKQEAKRAPSCDLHQAPLFTAQQIYNMLPHRYPFQLVDKIMALDRTSIIGIKNVTFNEPYFQGHFPGMPIMPGVLQVEALAQTSGIMLLHQVPDPENYLTYFLSIDACKFRRMIVPGDVLLLYCQLLSDIKFRVTDQQSVGIAKIKGRIFVSDHLACEAILLAQAVKKHGK